MQSIAQTYQIINDLPSTPLLTDCCFKFIIYTKIVSGICWGSIQTFLLICLSIDMKIMKTVEKKEKILFSVAIHYRSIKFNPYLPHNGSWLP